MVSAPEELDYLFDLDGYVLLKQALSPSEVGRLNTALDNFPATAPGDWHGRVQRQDHDEQRGVNWQNVTEGGPPFEQLIDHASWIEHIARWVGNRQSLWIDEAFANVRGPGGAINVHGGATGRDGTINYNGQYRHDNGMFHCGQVNVLVALTDIGPGDGATCLVPCSHKSSLTHPAQTGVVARAMDDDGLMVGATEIHMRAGDAAVFVDSLAHGSVRRSNPGERRIVVYRYCPSLRRSRFNYRPSAELLARLTPEQAAIVSRGAPVENLPPEALREELEALSLEELRALLRAKEAKL
jgi:hypothetical protein